MAKDKPDSGQYGDVVTRLQQIVEALEAGELSLEESLERFGEGVGLVKQGEKLLTDAEKRIEQLLSEEGRTAPLKVAEIVNELVAVTATVVCVRPFVKPVLVLPIDTVRDVARADVGDASSATAGSAMAR